MQISITDTNKILNGYLTTRMYVLKMCILGLLCWMEKHYLPSFLLIGAFQACVQGNTFYITLYTKSTQVF